eukprot:SAG25_NODE_849_length_5079_cov_19.384739_6_plen_217_part_00
MRSVFRDSTIRIDCTICRREKGVVESQRERERARARERERERERESERARARRRRRSAAFSQQEALCGRVLIWLLPGCYRSPPASLSSSSLGYSCLGRPALAAAGFRDQGDLQTITRKTVNLLMITVPVHRGRTRSSNSHAAPATPRSPQRAEAPSPPRPRRGGSYLAGATNSAAAAAARPSCPISHLESWLLSAAGSACVPAACRLCALHRRRTS